MKRMKIAISMSYDCKESDKDLIRDAVMARVEGMLELGDFDLLDEEEEVRYAPHGWEVEVVWEGLSTPPTRESATDDDRLEPDVFRYHRVHSPMGQELVEMFHGQPTKGTGEET